MKSEVKKKYEQILLEDVKNFSGYSLDQEEKTKGLKTINDEIKTLNDVETHKLDMAIKRKELKLKELKNAATISLEAEKHKLDIEKFNLQKLIEERKINLEENRFIFSKTVENTRLSLEAKKVNIEEAKLELEEQKFKESLRKDRIETQDKRIDRIINIGLELLKVGLPLAIYSSLVMKNFRLVYADDGRIPSEMRDLMKNIYKGKI